MDRPRRRRGCDSPQWLRCIRQKQRPKQININDLPHCLLQEIMEKVDHLESKGRCRLVCKLWRSLIPGSDPPFALIYNITSNNFQVTPDYASESSVFQAYRGFDFDYLPTFTWKDRRSVCVLASCQDLLLCGQCLVLQLQFYIVNPWTMDWIAFPTTLSWNLLLVPVGLIAKTSSVDPMGYQFRVVRLPHISFDFFEAEVFDPDVYHWRKVRVLHPCGLSWKPATYQGLAYNGALHWMVENGPIVAYDPFASPDGSGRWCCRFIMRSDAMRQNRDTNMNMKQCITVSEGSIRMVQLMIFPHGDEAHNLTVWKLKDYEGGEWVLDQRLYFKDMVSGLPELQHYVWEFVNKHESHDKYHRRIAHEAEPLACHPCNAHVIYMSCPSSIVSCNLLTKTLKMVSKRHVPRSLHTYDTAVPISALLQPTPVPRCPRNGPNRR